jgi:hypothetical protein
MGTLKVSEHKDFFTVIYNEGLWHDESRSGAGSTVEAAAPIIREIPELLRRYNVKSMLDIPCGDFTWMKEVALGDTVYVGADIVEPLIEENNIKYGRDGRRFRILDLLAETLPKFDLILCRDCFIHLTIPMIFSAMRNILASKSAYVLVSHYPWRAYSNNDDIEDLLIGGRRINLEASPFHFPPPLYSIPEGEKLAIAADKSLCLWDINALEEPLRLAEERYRVGRP